MSSATGSVYQRASDGRWVASVSLAGGKRVVRYGTTERDARRRLKEMLGKEHAGTLAAPNPMTFAAWVEQWLWMTAARCRDTTVEAYEYSMRPLVQRLGTTRLDRLTPLTLSQALADMQRSGVGTGRLRSSHAALRVCLRAAVRLDLMPVNAMDRVDAPCCPSPDRAHWALEEAAAFLQAAEASPTRFAPLFVFLLSTGMRRGEALALTWADVDLHERIVRIERSLVFARNVPTLHATKTKAARRVISLPDAAVRALGRLPRPLDPSG